MTWCNLLPFIQSSRERKRFPLRFIVWRKTPPNGYKVVGPLGWVTDKSTLRCFFYGARRARLPATPSAAASAAACRSRPARRIFCMPGGSQGPQGARGARKTRVGTPTWRDFAAAARRRPRGGASMSDPPRLRIFTRNRAHKRSSSAQRSARHSRRGRPARRRAHAASARHSIASAASSTSSSPVAFMSAAERASISRPWTIAHFPSLQVTGKE